MADMVRESTRDGVGGYIWDVEMGKGVGGRKCRKCWRGLGLSKLFLFVNLCAFHIRKQQRFSFKPKLHDMLNFS